MLIALLGPDFDKDPSSTMPADWPKVEAIRADTLKKPVVPVVHEGTLIHPAIGDEQSYVSFDFTNPESYAGNAHQLAKRILQAIELLRPPLPAMPLYYRRAAFHYAVARDGTLDNTVTHEVVAREAVSSFHHVTDTGLDASPSARMRVRNADRLYVHITASSVQGSCSLTLHLTEATEHAQKYIVVSTPELSIGDRIGYQRVFELENFFPLTSEELQRRSTEPGFPQEFRSGADLFYGTSFEVYYQTNLLTATYEFPASVPLERWRALALVDRSRLTNRTETARINAGNGLTVERPFDRPTVSLKLQVENPLIGHRYLLLYSLPPLGTAASPAVSDRESGSRGSGLID